MEEATEEDVHPVPTILAESVLVMTDPDHDHIRHVSQTVTRITIRITQAVHIDMSLGGICKSVAISKKISKE